MVSAEERRGIGLGGSSYRNRKSTSPKRTTNSLNFRDRHLLGGPRTSECSSMFSRDLMERSPVLMSSLQPFGYPSPFDSIRPARLLDRLSTAWDEESPFPNDLFRIRPSSGTRVIPIHVEHLDTSSKKSTSKHNVSSSHIAPIELDSDEDSDVEMEVTCSESPLPKEQKDKHRHFSDIQGRDSLHKTPPPKRKSPEVIEEGSYYLPVEIDSSSSLKHKSMSIRPVASLFSPSKNVSPTSHRETTLKNTCLSPQNGQPCISNDTNSKSNIHNLSQKSKTPKQLELLSLESNSNNNSSSSDSSRSDSERKTSVLREIPVILVDDHSKFVPNSSPVPFSTGGKVIPSVSSDDSSENSASATVSSVSDLDWYKDEKDVNPVPSYPVYDILKKKLLPEGRQIDYIRGDGNCFFRALSKHMYGSEKHHKATRSLIVDLIATNKKKFAQFIDNEDVQSHVEIMSEDGSWATTCEVYAAATLLQRDIYMLTPDYNNKNYSWLYFRPVFAINSDASKLKGDDPCYITLCNTNGNHYDRVVATHGGCNCFLPHPELDGVTGSVDLTS